jgi:hypothetical protein
VKKKFGLSQFSKGRKRTAKSHKKPKKIFPGYGWVKSKITNLGPKACLTRRPGFLLSDHDGFSLVFSDFCLGCGRMFAQPIAPHAGLFSL